MFQLFAETSGVGNLPSQTWARASEPKPSDPITSQLNINSGGPKNNEYALHTPPEAAFATRNSRPPHATSEGTGAHLEELESGGSKLFLSQHAVTESPRLHTQHDKPASFDNGSCSKKQTGNHPNQFTPGLPWSTSRVLRPICDVMVPDILSMAINVQFLRS